MARASPRTSMAVVLEVGARLKGQASRGTLMFSTTSLYLASGGFEGAGEGNYFDRKAFQRGKQIEQFLRGARITQGQNDVAVVDQAEIAVQGVHAVEDDAGGTGAGEGGGDFLADVAGFADAHHHDLAALFERFDDDFHGGGEPVVQLRPHGFEGLQFNVEHFARTRQMIHAHRLPSGRGIFNLDFTPRRSDVVRRMRTRLPMKILALLGCWAVAGPTSAQPPDSALEKAAFAGNAFGFKLLAETRKTQPGGNVFQSPVGMALALAMAGNGARGETLQQMAGTLQWKEGTPSEWNEGNKMLLDHLLALDTKNQTGNRQQSLDANRRKNQAGVCLRL